MTRPAIASLIVLCAQLACADFWVSIGSFASRDAADSHASAATAKSGTGFSARAWETSRGTVYRVVAGPHATVADASRDRDLAAGAGYADAWVLPGQPAAASVAMPATAPSRTIATDAPAATTDESPVADFGTTAADLAPAFDSVDALLDTALDIDDELSVEEWLKSIEAEVEQPLDVAPPRPAQPAMPQPELPEAVGEPPPDDYGVHRLRRETAGASSTPRSVMGPENRAERAVASAIPRPVPVDPVPAGRVPVDALSLEEETPQTPFTASTAPLAAEPLPVEEHFVEAAALSLLATDAAIPLVRRDNDARVRIDGRLDDDAWRELPVHDTFYVVDPDTLAPATLPTRVRIFYNDRGLYLAADMVQDPDTLVEQLSSRDQYLRRDYFSFTLDTSGEGRYGYWFQVSLGGSVGDGTVLPERQFSSNWDGAWHGASARTGNGWSAEFYVPWSLVSMPKADGPRAMGLYASRMIAHRDERLGWPALPFTLPKFLSAFQKLALNEVDPRQQYSVTPYVSATGDMVAGEGLGKAGLDVFWRPSTNFQLTSTLNPDFGNVEADDVIVNLTRYETFFPEKRLFFLEGQEIFTTNSRFQSDMVLLHTRRIGSAPLRPDVPDDVVVESGQFRQPSNILGALKTTGQQGGFRYGLLGAAEDDGEFVAVGADGGSVMLTSPGRDYGAARLLYEHANGGYQALGWMSTAVDHPLRESRVHAVDGHFVSPRGTLTADAQILHSAISGGTSGTGGIVDIDYSPRKGERHMLELDVFDDGVDIRDMGYLRRNDLRKFRYRYRFSRSNIGLLREARTYVFTTGSWNGGGRMVGAGLGVDQSLTLRNLSRLRFSGDVEPEKYDDWSSPGNVFRVGDLWSTEVRYESDPSRRLSWIVRHRFGEEEFGDANRRTRGYVTWRPNDRMTMNVGVGVRDRDGWLVHRGSGRFVTYEAEEVAPNLDVDLFVTARQHFRLGLQWVAIKADEQRFFQVPNLPGELVPVSKGPDDPSDDFAISRMNFQLRYRWEIAPLSDLFVVYTTNAGLTGGGDSPYLRRAYSGLFADTLEETLGEQLVVKLRYRLGS